MVPSNCSPSRSARYCRSSQLPSPSRGLPQCSCELRRRSAGLPMPPGAATVAGSAALADQNVAGRVVGREAPSGGVDGREALHHLGEPPGQLPRRVELGAADSGPPPCRRSRSPTRAPARSARRPPADPDAVDHAARRPARLLRQATVSGTTTSLVDEPGPSDHVPSTTTTTLWSAIASSSSATPPGRPRRGRTARRAARRRGRRRTAARRRAVGRGGARRDLPRRGRRLDPRGRGHASTTPTHAAGHDQRLAGLQVAHCRTTTPSPAASERESRATAASVAPRPHRPIRAVPSPASAWRAHRPRRRLPHCRRRPERVNLGHNHRSGDSARPAHMSKDALRVLKRARAVPTLETATMQEVPMIESDELLSHPRRRAVLRRGQDAGRDRVDPPAHPLEGRPTARAGQGERLHPHRDRAPARPPAPHRAPPPRGRCGLNDAVVVSTAGVDERGRAAGAHRAGRRRLPRHPPPRPAHPRHQLGPHAARGLRAPARTAGRPASTSCRSTAASASTGARAPRPPPPSPSPRRPAARPPCCRARRSSSGSRPSAPSRPTARSPAVLDTGARAPTPTSTAPERPTRTPCSSTAATSPPTTSRNSCAGARSATSSAATSTPTATSSTRALDERTVGLPLDSLRAAAAQHRRHRRRRPSTPSPTPSSAAASAPCSSPTRTRPSPSSRTTHTDQDSEDHA